MSIARPYASEMSIMMFSLMTIEYTRWPARRKALERWQLPAKDFAKGALGIHRTAKLLLQRGCDDDVHVVIAVA